MSNLSLGLGLLAGLAATNSLYNCDNFPGIEPNEPKDKKIKKKSMIVLYSVSGSGIPLKKGLKIMSTTFWVFGNWYLVENTRVFGLRSFGKSPSAKTFFSLFFFVLTQIPGRGERPVKHLPHDTSHAPHIPGPRRAQTSLGRIPNLRRIIFDQGLQRRSWNPISFVRGGRHDLQSEQLPIAGIVDKDRVPVQAVVSKLGVHCQEG